MKKENQLPEENQEHPQINEPTAAYSGSVDGTKVDSYYRSVEELKESVRRGMQQVKEGKMYSHEEVKMLRKP